MPKLRDGLTAKVRKAKASGLSAAAVAKILEDGAREAAARDGWRPSELAATLTDHHFVIARVYGKRAAAALDAARKPA